MNFSSVDAPYSSSLSLFSNLTRTSAGIVRSLNAFVISKRSFANEVSRGMGTGAGIGAGTGAGIGAGTGAGTDCASGVLFSNTLSLFSASIMRSTGFFDVYSMTDRFLARSLWYGSC